MDSIFANSATLGAVFSLAAFWLGCEVQKRFKLAVLNPLLIAMVIVITTLVVFDIKQESYFQSAKQITWFLNPATVALAIPLYDKLDALRANPVAIAFGLCVGVLSSLCGILAMAFLFGISHAEYVTLLPKSITTAIGMALSGEMGGNPAMTMAAIFVTGLFGNIFAEPLCKLFRIRHAVSRGLAIGAASHAMGTAKAMQMGETEGAMSSLAIVICGLITVVGANVFAYLY